MTDLVFYDIETAFPPQEIIEFGAITLDGRSFKEKNRYQTMIYSDKVSWRSEQCNHISQNDLKDAPSFAEVADKIFEVLDGKIWVGHNINTFDNPKIKAEFEKINKPIPEPIKTIDTLSILRKEFKGKTENFKMETLGHHFELGEEKHRAIEDCEMTIEVIKNSAMSILFQL